MFKEAVIDYAKEQVTKSSKENKKYKNVFPHQGRSEQFLQLFIMV